MQYWAALFDGLLVLRGQHGAGDGECTASDDERCGVWLEAEATGLQCITDVGGDAVCGFGRQRGIAIGDKLLSQAHRAELQGQGLLDLAVGKTDQFEAAAAEVHLDEVVDAGDLRVAAEPFADVGRFLCARQYLYFAASRLIDQFDKLDGIGRVAHRAGGNNAQGLRLVALCEAGELGDGSAASCHCGFC